MTVPHDKLCRGAQTFFLQEAFLFILPGFARYARHSMVTFFRKAERSSIYAG